MAEGMYRIAIVGASTLAGKELADELGESLLAASDVTLLDDEEEGGTVASVGEEAAVVQQIDEGSFERKDFVFFVDAEAAKKYWSTAREAGASIVDGSGALEGEPGVVVRAPFVQNAIGGRAVDGVAAAELDLSTVAVVPAAPAAVMLALVAERLRAQLTIRSLIATVFEPASEYGREAMDELHQQTVNLLSFQNLPREQYDAQVAFNVLPSLGEAARVDLKSTAAKIARHYRLAGGHLPELAIQAVHVPVFHGYVLSVLVELEQEARVHQVEAALEGESIDVVTEDSEPPSNLTAAGQEDIMVLVRAASETTTSRRFWLWLAADNLKLGALNAIACAGELRRLRPRGKVQ